MTLPFDENIAQQIVLALQALGHPAKHALEIVSRGTADEDLFPAVASRGFVLVTQDQRMSRNPHQRALLLGVGLGVFVYTGRAERSVDQMTILILETISKMEEYARRTDRPFIYGISDRGRFERLDR